MERARKWLVQSDFSCADISYSFSSEKAAALIVVMHFSRVVDGFSKDLELTFRQPLAVQWEDEGFGLIESPEDLPKCSGSSAHGSIQLCLSIIHNGQPLRSPQICRIRSTCCWDHSLFLG